MKDFRIVIFQIYRHPIPFAESQTNEANWGERRGKKPGRPKKNAQQDPRDLLSVARFQKARSGNIKKLVYKSSEYYRIFHTSFRIFQSEKTIESAFKQPLSFTQIKDTGAPKTQVFQFDYYVFVHESMLDDEQRQRQQQQQSSSSSSAQRHPHSLGALDVLVNNH